VHGIDYAETFALVAKLDSIRVVLAIAAVGHWEVHHMDVKGAFLYRDIASEKSALHDIFTMTYMGLLHYFLRLEINQSDLGIEMAQYKYAKDLLIRFQMIDCKPTSLPFLSGVKLEDGGTTPLVDSTRYKY
jgi:hypothetical protein